MVAEIHEVQHRRTGDMPDSAAYSLRETAAKFGTSYPGFREAMIKGQLPAGIVPLKVGGQWRFPKAQVDRVLGIEED